MLQGVVFPTDRGLVLKRSALQRAPRPRPSRAGVDVGPDELAGDLVVTIGVEVPAHQVAHLLVLAELELDDPRLGVR